MQNTTAVSIPELFGREREISIFSNRINQHLDALHKLVVLNIWGLDGIGKSTLLDHFQLLATHKKVATCFLKESPNTIPQMISQLTVELEKQGWNFNDFLSAYQKWEAGVETRHGVEQMIFAGLEVGANQWIPLLGTLVKEAGQVALNLRDQKTRRLWLQTNRNPEEMLIEKFQTELLEQICKKKICVFVDNYEEDCDIREDWLLKFLKQYKEQAKLGLTIVIASQKPISEDLRWVGVHENIQDIPLNIFNSDETTRFLQLKGINDPAKTQLIYKNTSGFPLFLQYADVINDFSEMTVDSFLNSIQNPDEHQMMIHAAIPRTYNLDVLTTLFGKDRAIQLFERLRNMKFIRIDGEKRWVFHKVIREQFISYVKLQSNRDWSDLHDKMNTYYEQEYQLLVSKSKNINSNSYYQLVLQELIYHSFCVDPQNNLAKNISLLVGDYPRNHPIRKLIQAFSQAEDDSNIPDSRRWGKLLMEGFENDNFEEEEIKRVELYQKLLTLPALPPQLIAKLNSLLGTTYYGFASIFRLSISQITVEESVKKQISKYARFAIEAFNRAIEIDNKNSEYYCGVGKCHYLLKDYVESTHAFQIALDFDESSIEALIGLGDNSLEINDFPNSINFYQKAINLYPSKPEYYLKLCECYEKAGDNSKAILICTDAIGLIPENTKLYYQRALLYEKEKSYQEALSDLKKILKSNPKYFFANYVSGRILFGQHEYQAVIDVIHPENDSFLILILGVDYLGYEYRGLSLFFLEKYNEAIHDLSCAISLNPGNLLLYYMRCNSYLFTKRYKKALQDINHVIETDPKYVYSHFMKGLVLADIGKMHEAISEFSSELQLSLHSANPDPRIYYARAQCYMGMSQFESAIEDFTKVLDINKDFNKVYFLRGLCYSLTNQPEKAKLDTELFASKCSPEELKSIIQSFGKELGIETDKIFYTMTQTLSDLTRKNND